MDKSGTYKLSDVLDKVKMHLNAGRIEAILLSSPGCGKSGEKTAMLDDRVLFNSQIIAPIMFLAGAIEFKVGRAGDNNLVLGYEISEDGSDEAKKRAKTFAKVSRYHAYFSKSKTGSLFLTDISSNGVFINGQRLLKNKPFELGSCAQVRFGPILAYETVWQFYRPDSFKAYLTLWNQA